MNRIIDTDIFRGIINLDTRSDSAIEAIGYAIDDYQEMFLRKLLGDVLYADMEINQTSTKYTELVNGSSYEVNGQRYIYQGLKKMTACFTWFYYTQQQLNINTNLGNMQPKPMGGDLVNDVPTLIQVWNMAVKLYNDAILFIKYKNSISLDYFLGFSPEELGTMNQFGI
jgi:hypothetical protein